MIPFIVAAAASIVSSAMKREQEKRENYLAMLRENAQRLGGDTRMARVIDTNRQIDDQGADYGGALSLVGKAFGDSGTPGTTDATDRWDAGVGKAIDSEIGNPMHLTDPSAEGIPQYAQGLSLEDDDPNALPKWARSIRL